MTSTSEAIEARAFNQSPATETLARLLSYPIVNKLTYPEFRVWTWLALRSEQDGLDKIYLDELTAVARRSLVPTKQGFNAAGRIVFDLETMGFLEMDRCANDPGPNQLCVNVVNPISQRRMGRGYELDLMGYTDPVDPWLEFEKLMAI